MSSFICTWKNWLWLKIDVILCHLSSLLERIDYDLRLMWFYVIFHLYLKELIMTEDWCDFMSYFIFTWKNWLWLKIDVILCHLSSLLERIDYDWRLTWFYVIFHLYLKELIMTEDWCDFMSSFIFTWKNWLWLKIDVILCHISSLLERIDYDGRLMWFYVIFHLYLKELIMIEDWCDFMSSFIFTQKNWLWSSLSLEFFYSDFLTLNYYFVLNVLVAI